MTHLAPRARRTKRFLAVALALLTISALAGASAAMAAPGAVSSKSTGVPADDPARGMVYRGLTRAAADGPCHGHGYEVRGAGSERGCTHGPDAAPAGVDVRVHRASSRLAPSVETAGTAALTSGAVPCHGDGVSGNRVQAIYAHASNVASRYSTIASWIRSTYAPNMDTDVNDSAAKTGGTRHIRWVTDGCVLNVAHVVLSTAGDDDIYKTQSELRTQGFTRTDRKYLVWMDANVYCGIAFVQSDDSAGSTNRNNGVSTVPGMVSRVDAGCWGGGVEGHELMHNLGGVQTSAPHGTSMWHCTDEYDKMCYSDGSGKALSYPCPSDQNRLFDCRNDDYFHTNPLAGSYLATHWNVARSSFLEAGGSVPPPPPPPPPPPSTYLLTVGHSGTGLGTVTSSPAGISCGSDCSQSYASGTLVTLTSVPSAGSLFSGWSGGCVGTAACVLTMSAAKTVTATFGIVGEVPPPTVTAVSSTDLGFAPPTVTPVMGTAVRWTFLAAGSHGVADNTGMGLFQSGLMGVGTWYQVSYFAAGSYGYRDQYAGYLGTVAVPMAISPSSGGTATTFTVRWSTIAAPVTVPFRYDVQILRPGGAWAPFRTGVRGAWEPFVPNAGKGTYLFRARMRNTTTGLATGWSPVSSVSVV